MIGGMFLLYSYAENGRYGMVNEHGEVIVEPKYKIISNRLIEGYALGYMNGIWTYINDKGRVVKNYNSIEATVFHEGMAAIVKNYLTGFIDKRFRVVVPLKYGFSLVPPRFSEGIAKVGTPLDFEYRKFGFINKNGEEIIDLKFDDASNFSEGLAVVSVGEKSGAINYEGQFVIEPKYDFLNDCQDGSLVFINNGLLGVLDRNGNLLVEPNFEVDPEEYYLSKNFSDGYLPITENDKYSFIDENGNQMVDYIYDDIRHFCEGFAGVNKNGKWAIINTKFEQITDYEFEDIFHFSEGLVAVKVDDKWGYVDTQGKVVIEPIYEGITDFKNGLAGTLLNNCDGLINKFGEDVFRAEKPQGNVAECIMF